MKRFKIISLISIAIAAITTATIVSASAGVYEDIRGVYAGKASIKESSLAGNVYVKSYRWAELTITTQTDAAISAATLSLQLTDEDPAPVEIPLTGLVGSGSRPYCELYGTSGGMTVYFTGHAIFRRNVLYSFTGKIIAMKTGSTNNNVESSIALKLQ